MIFYINIYFILNALSDLYDTYINVSYIGVTFKSLNIVCFKGKSYVLITNLSSVDITIFRPAKTIYFPTHRTRNSLCVKTLYKIV